MEMKYAREYVIDLSIPFAFSVSVVYCILSLVSWDYLVHLPSPLPLIPRKFDLAAIWQATSDIRHDM